MTSVQTPPSETSGSAPHHFDPEEFRMSVGDHLEELRRRIVLGLVGFFVAAVACLTFGDRVVTIFCRPLIQALQRSDVNPQLFTDQPTDAFMVYIKISLICAAAIASPWMVYQLWQFVATGLYAHERKYVTKYVPYSLGLLITGMLFVYFAVLPLTLTFFTDFTTSRFKLPIAEAPKVQVPADPPPTFVQSLPGDPINPKPFQLWYDSAQRRLKVYVDNEVRVIPFGSNNLLAPHYTLPDYVDLVLRLLLTFGLAFQLPLVVLALARIGIVDIPMLKHFRRYVYFGITILAAALTPGDVVTAMVALMIPLILLYEMGIFFAAIGEKKAQKQ